MSDTTQAIATLRAYAVSCHDEIAQAGARLVAAYAQLETQVQAQAEEIERLRAIIVAAVQVSAERGEQGA